MDETIDARRREVRRALNRNLEELGIAERFCGHYTWQDFQHLWAEIALELTRAELERRRDR